MRYIILLFSALLFGCTSKPDADNMSISKIYSKSKVLMEDTFPFSVSDKIEVISYITEESGNKFLNDKGIVDRVREIKDKKLQVNPAVIKDRITLSDSTTNELFSFLFNEECPLDSSVAACFDPRHCVVFYNNKSEIIAYTEICLGCSSTYNSEGFTYNNLCIERMDGLLDIFKKAGVKYFGKEE